MGSKTIKTALVVGAIAVGFAAIPAIGPSAFATKVGAFVAPSLGATAQGLIGTFLVSAGTQLVLGAVNSKLAPELDPPDLGTNLQQGTMVTAKSGIAPHRIIYGKTRVGGVMVYAETTGSTNDFLHIVIAIAGHEINKTKYQQHKMVLILMVLLDYFLLAVINMRVKQDLKYILVQIVKRQMQI
jgi:hypothetical protein